MRNIKIAALQFSCCSQVQENIDKAETMVREAASNVHKRLRQVEYRTQAALPTAPISSFFLNYLKDRIFVRKSDTIIMIMPCL